jgi:hypothetical protein
MRTASRAGTIAALAASVLLAALLLAPAASAIGQQDQQQIGELRQIFSVQEGQASDEELAAVLDSKEIGPSVAGELACAVQGQEVLSGRNVDRAISEALAKVVQQAVTTNPFADSLIALLASRVPMPLGFLLALHSEIASMGSQVETYAGALATLINLSKYRELLILYRELADEYQTSEEEQEAIERDYPELLAAAAKASKQSAARVLAEDHYASSCAALAEDAGERAGYGLYVASIVADTRSYGEHGGASRGGLSIVRTDESTAEVVNDGQGIVKNVALLDASGHPLARIGELEPGQSEAVMLPAGESPVNVRFDVDGVEGIERSYGGESAQLYVGQGQALANPEESETVELGLASGPFVAKGLAHTYKWDFGDGASASQTPVSHKYGCYGESEALFTARVGEQQMIRAVIARRPPPFTPGWSTSEEGAQAVPGVPVTFTAHPSIPGEASVSWDFGDGAHVSGREATHTYAGAGEFKATMSVTLPGATCALMVTNTMVVGRASDWLPLSANVPSMRLSPRVAGYVVTGSTTVNAGNTLTVPAGVNVKFLPANGEPGQLIIKGSLKVEGAAGAPAVFTSRYDDGAGGHCTCAVSGHSPQSGDWWGITLLPGANASFEHAAIRYAGRDVDLQGGGASATIADSALTDSGVGVYSRGVNAIALRATTLARENEGVQLECSACSYAPQLSGVSFEEDTTGIAVSGGAAPRVDSASFTAVKTPVSLQPSAARTLLTHTTVTAGARFIAVAPGNYGRGSTRLASDMPYVQYGEAVVPAGGALTLPPGAVLKFYKQVPSEAAWLDVAGSLLVQGTASSSATMTSAYDDTAGGHCTCVGAARAPAPGDWSGVLLRKGASAILDRALVGYAGSAFQFPGTEGTLQATDSTIASSGVGIEAPMNDSISVTSSSFREDTTGLLLGCSGCAAQASVVNSSFPGSREAAWLRGSAHLEIHGSTFEASQVAIDASESSSANASENWWGAADGPRPTGSGAAVVGNVSAPPFCVNDECTTATLALSQPGLVANGTAQTTAIVTVARAGLPRAGDRVTIASSDPGERLGPVTDNEDGTYSTTITASKAVGTATITATDAAVSPAAGTSTQLTQGLARKVKVMLKPSSLPAAGVGTATATVTVTAGGVLTPGDEVALTAADPGVAFGAVKDNGNGTYSVTLSPSNAIGKVALSATDTTLYPYAKGTGTLTQSAPKLKLVLKPTSIVASGAATTTLTIKVTAAGKPRPGERLRLESSDPGVLIGPITDHLNGTYTATITGSVRPGSVTITAVDETVQPQVQTSVALTQT